MKTLLVSILSLFLVSGCVGYTSDYVEYYTPQQYSPVTIAPSISTTAATIDLGIDCSYDQTIQRLGYALGGPIGGALGACSDGRVPLLVPQFNGWNIK